MQSQVSVAFDPEAATLSAIDCLVDPEWDQFVSRQPAASFFHSSAWAAILKATYGHQPLYIVGRQNGAIVCGFPIMEVRTWLRPLRAVALPFTDLCPPLLSNGRQFSTLFEAALECGGRRGWKYLECRSDLAPVAEATPSLKFWTHVVDLTPGPDTVLLRFENSVRRGIRKAQAVGLSVSFETGIAAMRVFFDLHCQTRRRHGVPPQPFRFFENIVRLALAAGRGFVAIARHQGRAIAALVFLLQGRRAIYKFGASDIAFQHLRPNNLLMWESLRRCAARGAESVHLGRTSLSNEGLRRFKLGFGAQEQQASYYQYDFGSGQFVIDVDHAESWINPFFSRMPLPLLKLAGRMLYPHLA